MKMTEGQDRITIIGPQSVGTYVVEFRPLARCWPFQFCAAKPQWLNTFRCRTRYQNVAVE